MRDRLSVCGWVALTMISIVAGGCSAGSADGRKEGASRGRLLSEPVRDAGAPAPTPASGCTPEAAAQAVDRYFDALERGNWKEVEASIAPHRDFQWYSVTDSVRGQVRRHFSARNPQALLRYLRRRYRQRERLRLLELKARLLPPRSWFPDVDETIVGLEYAVRRTADDLPVGKGVNSTATGKGGLICNGGRLIVWSMGLERNAASAVRGFICPRARRDRGVRRVCGAGRSKRSLAPSRGAAGQ